MHRLLSNWTLAKESEFRVVYKGLDVRGLLLEEAGERHKRSRDEGESDGDMTLYVFKEEEDFKVVKQPSSHFFPKKHKQTNKNVLSPPCIILTEDLPPPHY